MFGSHLREVSFSAKRLWRLWNSGLIPWKASGLKDLCEVIAWNICIINKSKSSSFFCQLSFQADRKRHLGYKKNNIKLQKQNNQTPEVDNLLKGRKTLNFEGVRLYWPATKLNDYCFFSSDKIRFLLIIRIRYHFGENHKIWKSRSKDLPGNTKVETNTYLTLNTTGDTIVRKKHWVAQQFASNQSKEKVWSTYNSTKFFVSMNKTRGGTQFASNQSKEKVWSTYNSTKFFGNLFGSYQKEKLRSINIFQSYI